MCPDKILFYLLKFFIFKSQILNFDFNVVFLKVTKNLLHNFSKNESFAQNVIIIFKE